MSYDLFLQPRAGTVSAEQFQGYFNERPHYAVEGNRAGFFNPDTGVGFAFTYNPEPSRKDDFSIYFNINVMRPSFFFLEACPEVTDLIKHFDILIVDPQTEGANKREYDQKAFLESWTNLNLFACEVLLKREPGVVYVPAAPDEIHLPMEQLNAAWRWNRNRKKMQEDDGDFHVPKIGFALIDGVPATLAIIPSNNLSVICEADFLSIAGSSESNRSVLTWREARPMFNTWEEAWGEPIEGYPPLFTTIDPVYMDEYLDKMPPNGRKVVKIEPAGILDREIVEQALNVEEPTPYEEYVLTGKQLLKPKEVQPPKEVPTPKETLAPKSTKPAWFKRFFGKT